MKDNELLQEEVSSLEKKVLELTASRDVQQTSDWYFVDKLIHAEPNRRQITLAVVLPALVSFVSAALYLFFTEHLDEPTLMLLTIASPWPAVRSWPEVP